MHLNDTVGAWHPAVVERRDDSRFALETCPLWSLTEVLLKDFQDAVPFDAVLCEPGVGHAAGSEVSDDGVAIDDGASFDDEIGQGDSWSGDAAEVEVSVI